MQTLTTIKHHISALPAGEIFTTRQMLKYGERKRIDLALSQLVREGKIKRLSYGVFCLAKIIPENNPTQIEVVLAKTDVHCHVFIGSNQTSISGGKENVFFTDKKNGSFISQGEKIVLRKVCGRKYSLSQSSTGRVLLALWLTGKRGVDAQMVHEMLEMLPLEDRKKLRDYLELVPGWLHCFLIVEITRMGY